MKKYFIIYCFIGASLNVFAQQSPQTTQNNKSILDIVSEKVKIQIQEEEAKKNTPQNNTDKNSDITKYYKTPGASYDENILTGLDEYNRRQIELQKKVDEIKAQKEAEVEAARVKALEEQKRNEEAAKMLALQKQIADLKKQQNKPSQSQSDTSGTKRKKTSPNTNNQDYFDRQRKLMESQSY